ncbi:hypothetical protein DERP_014042, partial [Dermatophagoides pteronyssinus]
EPTGIISGGPSLWPEPKRYLIDKNHSPYLVGLPINFQLINNHNDKKQCDIIQYNFNKYRYLINKMIEINTNQNCNQTTEMKFLSRIEIHIDQIDCQLFPEFVDNENSENESYQIQINPMDGIGQIISKTVWGMIRAMETLSQLIYVDSNHPNCSRMIIDVIQVWDRPRFRYRSIMIDTARHYLPLWLIIENLDAMAQNKLNVLHWHINDDQSFPFESQVFANISRIASYSERHVYSRMDIEKIIGQAKIRGIQVIVEFNTPAHCQSLGKIFPGIMSRCNNNVAAASMETLTTTSNKQPLLHSNIINPSQELTYDILEKILTEFRQIFPSNRIHLGMDDISYECWSNDQDIRQFMGANRMHSFEKLEQYHLERMINITVEKLHSKPIIWQDPFDKDIPIPSGTIIQVWKDYRLLDNDQHDWKFHVEKLLHSNYTVILSACYFLNLIQYGQQKDWKQIYNCDPHDFNGFNREQKQQFVIGGEALIWSEYIDQTNFMSRVWPRASAMAERLWSHIGDDDDNPNFDDDIVEHRLDHQRCRMIGRGIPAQPISTGFCEHFDNMNNEKILEFAKDFRNKDKINSSNMFHQEFLSTSTTKQHSNKSDKIIFIKTWLLLLCPIILLYSLILYGT